MFTLFHCHTRVTPTGCTAIQFWYWLPKVCHKAHFRCQLQVSGSGEGSPDHLYFLLTGYKFGDSHDPLWFDNLLDQLTELRKMLCLPIIVLLQGVCLGWCLGGSCMQSASMPSPLWIRGCHPPGTSRKRTLYWALGCRFFYWNLRAWA